MRFPSYNGTILKKARKKTKMTQEQFAQRMGMSRQTINKIENNDQKAIEGLKLKTVQKWHTVCKSHMSQEMHNEFLGSLLNFLNIKTD